MPEFFETEGWDRPDMELPGRQNELIRRVVEANPNTVVVFNAGAPVSLPWQNEIPAILEAFYPGMEGGNAVARILLGEVNPSGKLPVTFPKRLEDTPAYINSTYPGAREILIMVKGYLSATATMISANLSRLFHLGMDCHTPNSRSARWKPQMWLTKARWWMSE